MTHEINTLFGEKVITTIGFNEQEIIRDILHLHAPGKHIDCDPTFSVGNFYKNGLVRPPHIFDKTPQVKGVIEATADKLPLPSESIEVCMFDPPFAIGGKTYAESKEGSCVTSKRFTSFTSFQELAEMYTGSMKEIHRILKDKGILIFKCQDQVSGGRQYFIHCWVMYKALEIGYYPKDLFILLAKNRINDGRKQQHGRKYHSYFWVFQKQVKPVTYYDSN